MSWDIVLMAENRFQMTLTRLEFDHLRAPCQNHIHGESGGENPGIESSVISIYHPNQDRVIGASRTEECLEMSSIIYSKSSCKQT